MRFLLDSPDLSTHPAHLPHATHLTHLTHPPHPTSMRAQWSGALSVLTVVIASTLVASQAPTISRHTDAPPTELADPIEALMAPQGERVVVGGTTLEFWWVKSMPLLSSSTDVSWSAVEEGTLVGTVALSASYPDIRAGTMKAGIYTLRYGIQPADGAHTGVSPYRDFLLLAPAASDNSVAALGHDGAVALAKQALGGGHPASWCLDPPIAAGEVGSTRVNEAGQTSVVFSVPVSRDGKDVGTLKFGLVLVGTVQ